MGRYGQAILTIAGYVVGSYFGYPQLGALVGGLVGSYLFPPELPTLSGPRLSDITQTTSAVGTSIPRGWGTFSVAGSVIYQSDLREVIVSEDVGGKGGPSQTVETPTYYQDFAISLCEGEDPIANLTEIAGVRRIWANGKPIYDRRPRQDDETESEFNQRIAASNVLDTQMVVYLGTEEQMPDPTLETNLGVGNVSAFRGLAYIVFINWQNKQEDGNKMPLNWKFEVYTSGALDPNTAFEYSNEYLPPWNAGEDIPLYADSRFYRFNVETSGWTYGSGRWYVPGSWNSLQSAQNAAAAVALRTADFYMGYSITPFSGSTAARGVTHLSEGEFHRTVGNYDAAVINLHFNAVRASNIARSGNSFAALVARGLAPGENVNTNGYFYNNDMFSRSTRATYQWWPGDYWSGARYRNSSALVDNAITTGRSTNPGAVLATGDMIITVRRNRIAPGDQCAITVPSLPGYCISTRGNLVRMQSWERVDVSFVNLAKVLARYSTTQKQIPGESINHRVTVVAQYPLNPALPSGHANYNNQAFWEEAYATAVAVGAMPAGLTYGVNYPRTQDFYYRRTLTQDTIDTNPIPLNEVVRDIMRESGYADADFDVAALEDDTILGYVRTRVMAGRAVVEPLRQAKFFDMIESGVTQRLIKAVKRGGSIVASITEDELGCAVAGEEPPSKMSTQSVDETTLPRSVRVHYLSLSRDYEPGEQISPARIETNATNDVDIELPMVLTDDEAAQIAEVLWSEAWTGRKLHQTVIDARRQELEPSDPIEVPIDNKTHRVRILSIEDSLPALRRLELIRDDDGSYVSNAIGSTPGYVRHPIQIASPAELVLLDLPALRDSDDDAGIYAAMRPYMTDADFRGAHIMRSTDGGGSYSSVATVSNATPMGVVLNNVSDAEHTIWDYATAIRVQMNWGDLENRSEQDVLNGANAAAIGEHGRWEIVQFQNATLIAPGIWELTTLLRGRRGTERNVGTGLLGDHFVMLSMGGLVRVPLSNSDIGLERLYKGVAAGTMVSDAAAISLTAEGEALKPFSPVHLSASLEDDGDIVLRWIRRNRLGMTMQSNAEIAMSETVEEYEVDIVIDGVVTRTLEATSDRQVTYTLAQQTADFISSTVSFVVNVYQMSAVVGRGHVGSTQIVLDDVEGDGGTEPLPDVLDEPDADAIIVPLTYDEVNEAVSPLTWTRLGDGPRLTPEGMLGDSYEARLRATAGLPSFITSNVNALYLRAVIRAFGCGAQASADRIISICVNDATANPRLEFVIVDDSTVGTEPNIALRSFTGSMQTKRLSRREWRFVFTHPEKVRSTFGVRPQGILYSTGVVLTTEHYESNFSTCHQVNSLTGEALGFFQFGAGLNQVSSIADRASDGSIWFCDEATGHVIEVDVPGSMLSQAAITISDVNFTSLSSTRAIEWAVVGVDEEGEGGTEYFLLAEFASGLIYMFEAADIVNGATITASDRVKRLQGPTNITGIVYLDGSLYISSYGPSASRIVKLDFDTWVASGTDDEAYAGYELADYGVPSAMVRDIDFDPSANLWMQTEGYATSADDTDWFAVWQSPLLDDSVDNVFSAYYNGSGSVEVRVNDRHFCSLAWTPTPTPGAISIGGPPQASAGQGNGFFSGVVRDVIIQGTDYDPEDFGLAITLEGDGNITFQYLELINPDAEDGVNGWTNEVGTLTQSSSVGHDSAHYFFGGTTATCKARQRIDLSTAIDFDVTRLDAGDCWAIVRWWGNSFSSQTDNEQMGLRFLDASQVQIAEHLSGTAHFDEWVGRSYGILIPANTRYIDILMQMNRVSGSNNDGYIDDISAGIYIPVPNE